MKTTLNIAGDLIHAVKTRALEQDTTMTAIIEYAVRQALTSSPAGTRPFKLNLRPVKGKLRPGVDITSRESLYEFLDGTRWRGDRG